MKPTKKGCSLKSKKNKGNILAFLGDIPQPIEKKEVKTIEFTKKEDTKEKKNI